MKKMSQRLSKLPSCPDMEKVITRQAIKIEKFKKENENMLDTLKKIAELTELAFDGSIYFDIHVLANDIIIKNQKG